MAAAAWLWVLVACVAALRIHTTHITRDEVSRVI
jgi:hypothetical protein